ncbi:MAG: tetratricopeptide repeat protein, partial [Candidatus Aegiribacteria sp.]|nr:tetratricopeptide repeat protein [Candidatus Aegiribacteria sp.]
VLAVNPEDYNALREKGVSLYKKGDEDASIELFDKALAVNPEDYHAMRQKGVSLSRKGDVDAAIEWFDKALAMNSDDYHNVREKGVSLYKKGNIDASIEWFDKALSINPEDYHAMRQKGISLSRKGDEDASIEWFDKALTVNPEDYNAMRQKAVALSMNGEEDAAIEWFDKALTVNPKDYHAILGKGVALLKKRELDAAIELFDKVLAVNPEDYHALHQKAVSLWNMGERYKAFELHCQALSFSQNEKDYFDRLTDELRFLCRTLQVDFQQKWREVISTDISPAEEPNKRLFELQSMIALIQEELKGEYENWLEKKRKAEEEEQEFLNTQSCFLADLSLFLVLRKWNSNTPIIPRINRERSKGGGYYLRHGDKGIVIDPGYNFLENFAEAGGRICDIDIVIITHAHDDHTADFEALCSLLNKFNKTAKENGSALRRIRLYLNNGAFMKFSGILNLKNKAYIERVITLNPGQELNVIQGVILRVLPAYHDEVVARDQAVGLLFTINCQPKPRRILCTGDTGLFPLKDEKDPTADGRGKPLLECYPSDIPDNLDLLVAHVGSIKEEEFTAEYGRDPSQACYPNHLGIIGTAALLCNLRPVLGVVAEFGEETRNFRKHLIQRLQTSVIDKFLEGSGLNIPRVVPGDIPFIYNIASAEFYCIICKEWVDCQEIDFDIDENTGTVYYLSKELREELKDNPSRFSTRTKEFNELRNMRSGLYFRNDLE